MTMSSMNGARQGSIPRRLPAVTRKRAKLRPVSTGLDARTDGVPSSSATPEPAARAAKPRLLSRLAEPAGFTLATLAIAVGWYFRDSHELTAESGLGYALGIVAVSCMLILLIYPLRKRFKWLRLIGPVRNWFRTHMILGVLGPLAALYHCNFQLGSMNSRIALYSALMVAGSGLIGRFLYSRIHSGLYGRRKDLEKLRVKMQLEPTPGKTAVPFMPELKERIRIFDEDVLDPDRGLTSSLLLLPRLSVMTRLEYASLIQYARKQLAAEARRSPLIADHERRLFQAMQKFLRGHLATARQLAALQLYDRLFAFWHVVHVPFFVLLILTVIVHVFAVHLY